MAHIFAPGDNPLRMDFNIQRILGPNVAVTRSAQSLVYEVDGYRYAFTASGPGTGLTYDAQGRPIAGVMTAFEYSKDGVLLYSQAGLYFSADTLASSGSFLSPNGIPDRNFLLSLALGNDHFHGSAQDDWIIDIANHNILDGGAGRDTLIAGDGNDHIYGHSANGGPDGADSIQAGGGGDYVQGNAGNDIIFGGAGSTGSTAAPMTMRSMATPATTRSTAIAAMTGSAETRAMISCAAGRAMTRSTAGPAMMC